MAIKKRMGKQHVSFMPDASVIEFFKARAGDRGDQTLNSQTFLRAMDGKRIEDTLRKAIREELEHAR